MARADTVTAGDKKWPGVTVLRADAGKLFFRTPAGVETTLPLANVTHLQLDDEPALSAAEAAAAAGGDPDAAAEQYLRALRGTARLWLRPYIATRLYPASARAGRPDLATSAYLLLLQHAAANASSAGVSLSDLPTPPPLALNLKPGSLLAAADQVDAALSGKVFADADSAVRHALLEYMVALCRAARDDGRTLAALARLITLPGIDAAAAEAAHNARAEIALRQATDAAAGGQPTDVAPLLQSHADDFLRPIDQAEALYFLAYAAEARAKASRAPKDLQDAALAYVRVAAHFREEPAAQRRIPTSLLRTALLLEDLQRPAEARKIFAELAAVPDAAGEPSIVSAARQGMQRTEGQTSGESPR